MIFLVSSLSALQRSPGELLALLEGERVPDGAALPLGRLRGHRK